MRYFPHTFAALIVALTASVAHAEIRWENNLRAAKEKAEQEGKLLLLHFYSDNCVWCDRLEAGAYQSPEVAAAIHQHYVPVKIHAGQNPTTAKTFRVSSFPTDVIVTPSGNALAHGTSPQAADQYIAMLGRHVPAATAAPVVVASNAPAPEPTPQIHASPVAAAAPATIAQDVTAAVGPNASPVGGTPAMAVSHRSAPNTSAAMLPKAPAHKLALDGYCAVSLLEKNDWFEGNPEFGVIHLGYLYLFSDEAAMSKFLANPEPFTPVLNGIDVVRFFEEKKIVPGKRDFGVKDPDHNRMFFFADHAAMVHFENQHTRYTDAAITVTRQAVADANPRR
jgi:hypothetical protein